MQLRIDHLLNLLRTDPESLLQTIDSDPLLVKREIQGLVLANASKELFTPQLPHQLFAKGIVYQRQPYRLISLPLIKIFNLGERDVTMTDLLSLQEENQTVPKQFQFLRKYDGTMVQRFQLEDKTWFTTRGMIEGIALTPDANEDDEASERLGHFDYLAAARQIAQDRYPNLLQPHPEWHSLSFVLELIHPESRVITDYGNQQDLILLTVFDRQAFCYWTWEQVKEFAMQHGLTAVDAFTPTGTTLAEQIDSLLQNLQGTDQEGTVLALESPTEVVYRVKIKSPDYLRLLKLMVHCSYPATVEMLDTFPTLPTWPEFELFLQKQGTEQVPEEVLGVYREHYEAFCRYLQASERLQAWAEKTFQQITSTIVDGSVQDLRAYRKSFAQQATKTPHPALLFARLDQRLTIQKIREYAPTMQELQTALEKITVP